MINHLIGQRQNSLGTIQSYYCLESVQIGLNHLGLNIKKNIYLLINLFFKLDGYCLRLSIYGNKSILNQRHTGQWVVYYTNPQSLIITYSYSLGFTILLGTFN